MPSRPTSRPCRALVGLAVLVVFGPGAAACAGPRSSLGAVAEPTTVVSLPGGGIGTGTGSPEVDAVLARLEGPLATPFTASYTILRRLGATQAGARVTHGPLATSVTVREVRFLLQDDTSRTCNLRERTCEEGVVDARISDLGLSAKFWRDSPARALRVASSRRAGAPTGSTATVGGQPAQCVDVPVGTGVERYCALAIGVIARWDTAYVDVEVADVRPSSNQEDFSTG